MSQGFCCLSAYVYISYAEFLLECSRLHLRTDTATLQICSGCLSLMLYVVYVSSCTPVNIIYTYRSFPLTTIS